MMSEYKEDQSWEWWWFAVETGDMGDFRFFDVHWRWLLRVSFMWTEDRKWRIAMHWRGKRLFKMGTIWHLA